MSRRGRDRDPLHGDERGEARERGRAQRREDHLGERSHDVTACPECRTQIPTLEGFNELPEECPDCGARLRCGTCRGSLVEAERESDEDEAEVPLERGECPRCGDPVTGEETGPASDEFTWDSQ